MRSTDGAKQSHRQTHEHTIVRGGAIQPRSGLRHLCCVRTLVRSARGLSEDEEGCCPALLWPARHQALSAPSAWS